MKQIEITRDSNGAVAFESVSIDVTENVFFTNLDPQAAHWPYVDKAKFPDLCDNQIGPAPSPNSSQCTVPVPQDSTISPPVPRTPPYEVTYHCNIEGHDQEKGIIEVFAQLAAANTALANAIKGQPIAEQQVVKGGKSPYTITGQLFQITDNQGNVIQSGSSSIGPGLQLNPDQTNNGGITVSGTPTVSGTYNFTFTVDDDMGRNLQQVQYSMKVA